MDDLAYLEARKPDTTPTSSTSPTHRCKVCGAYWAQWRNGWSLVSRQAGLCCDNHPTPALSPLVITDVFTRIHPDPYKVAEPDEG